MLRAAGRCPSANRTFRARDSRMAVADLVLPKSRAPVSFIKHLFIFGLFNTPRHGYRGLFQCRSELEVSCEGYRRSCCIATARVRTRRHTTLLSKRGAFTDWICEASLSLESQAVSLPGGQDYKPVQSILLTFFRLSRGADLTGVGLVLF